MRKTIPAAKHAFTLIELLTVIAIIVILAGLLLPAISAARRYAKIGQAKNDIKNIQTAIRAYYNEYGKLPVQDKEQGGAPCEGGGIGDGYYGEGGGGTNGVAGIYQYEIIDILRDIQDAINTNDVYNLRRIVFLQIPNRANALVNSGTLQGTFLDPWGNPYFIKLDNDYNNIVHYYGPGRDCPDTVGYTTLALIISYGPNGIQEDPTKGRVDDIYSFQ